MTGKPQFVVQTFKKVRGGRIVPGAREPAPTENGARKRAEAMATRLPATAALSIMVDEETGEVHSATILATHGEVPDDFAESLTGG